MKKLYASLAVLICLFTNQVSAQFWSNQNVGYSIPLAYVQDIDVVNTNICWTATSFAVDGLNKNYNLWSRTIDGGMTWSSGDFTLDTNYQVSNISAVDEDTCYILTWNKTRESGGYLFRTIDGGLNWDTIATGQIFTDTTTSFPNVVHFWSADSGIVMGDPLGGYYEVYLTSDGGTTWNRVPQANFPALSANEFGLVNVAGSLGDFIYFGANNGKIYRSYDKGNTWVSSVAGTLNPNIGVNNVTFRDSLHGFVVRAATGPVYTQFRTSDAGASWTPVIPVGTLYRADVMYVPGSTSLISVGLGTTAATGGSSISYDDGLNWITLDTSQGTLPNVGYSALDFIDPTTGWAGSVSVNAVTSGIFRWSGGTVGLPSANTEASSLNAYPNPSASLVFLETGKTFKSGATLSITDVMGREVSSRYYSAWTNPMTLNISSLQNGVYFVRVSSGNDVMVKRIVKN